MFFFGYLWDFCSVIYGKFIRERILICYRLLVLDTIDAILEYVTHTMSPYIYDNGELEKLCDAIRRWADDWQYIPLLIRLKSTLSTLDLRHFVWNIAERLGSKIDYTGHVRADFIKRMFPDVMRDIEQDSIRNFKFQPDTGSIVIDEPDKGDYHFHFE